MSLDEPQPLNPNPAPLPDSSVPPAAPVPRAAMDATVPEAGPKFDTPYNLFLAPPPDPVVAPSKPFFTPPVGDPNSPLSVLASAGSSQPTDKVGIYPSSEPSAPAAAPASITAPASSSPTIAQVPRAALPPNPLHAPEPLSSASAPEVFTPTVMPQPMVVSGSADSSPISRIAGSKPIKRGGKKKRLFIGAILTVVIILGGGYVFAFYLPNTPSNVYSTSLDHTARAYDKLVDYTGTVGVKKYKSVKLDGSFKLTSSTVAADGTFSGQSSNKDSTGSIKVDVAGENISVNARSVTASGQDTADVYFQVNGIKSILDTYGLNTYDTLDGQWISVDHTLLESAAASAAKDGSTSANLKAPTSAQIQDGLAHFGQVNRQYIFKADKDHAVLKDEKYLGKSTRDGRSVYGYQVGYDKAHLKAYIKAIQSSLNDSSLNAWVKQASGKSIAQTDIKSYLSEIDKAKSDYTFTMYVDAQTKLVNTLHFKDTSSSDYFEIGQQYTGGSVYPFSFKLVSTADTSNDGTFTMTAKIDSATNKIAFAANLDAKEDGTPLTFSLKANSAVSNDTLNVTAPTGAKSVMDIYKSLGLNDLYGASTDVGSDDSSAASAFDDFVLTQ